MVVVAVSRRFNERMSEIEGALLLARQGDASAALQALACAEGGFRGDSLKEDGDYGAISMMRCALRVRIEFGLPVDGAFWGVVDFIEHRVELPPVQRKIARRSLKAILMSMPSPSKAIAAWMVAADTEITSSDIDAVRSGS